MYGIYTYIWLIFMVNVAKYTSPMDTMGFAVGSKGEKTSRSTDPPWVVGSKVIAADLEAFDPEYFSNLKWMLDNARGAQGGLGKGVKWRLKVVNFFWAI